MSVSEVPEELMEEGRFSEALEALETRRNAAIMASGSDGYFSLISEIKIAQILCKQGRYDEALSMFTELEKKFKAFSDPYYTEIFMVKENIADVLAHKRNFSEAFSVYKEIYEYRFRTLGPRDGLTVLARRNVAVTLSKSGKFDESLNILEEIYVNRANYIGFKDHDILLTCSDIASIYLKQSKHDLAMNIFREIYEILLRKKPNHWNTWLAKRNIARVLAHQQKYDEALKLYEEVYLDQSKRKPKHPETLETLQSLAEIHEIKGDYKEALLHYRKLYDIRSLESPSHPDTIKALRCVTTLFLKLDQYNEAMDSYTTLIANVTTFFGAESKLGLEIQQSMALLLFYKGKYDRALEIFSKVHHIQSEMKALGPDHPDAIMTKINIGGTYLGLLNYGEAIKIFNEVLERLKRELGPNDSKCRAAEYNIALIYANQKKYIEAFQIYYDIYEEQAKTLGLKHPDTLKCGRYIDLLTSRAPMSKLMRATYAGDFNTLKFRVEIEDADVNERDLNDCTPLHIASEKGNLGIVKFLLSKGAIYNAQNRKRKTPSDVSSNPQIKSLFYSLDTLFKDVKEGLSESIPNILKEDEICVNARDQSGKTCLYWASEKGLIKTVKLLLDNEADPTLKNLEGDMPLHAVITNTNSNNEEIAEVLLMHMLKNSPDSHAAFVNSLKDEKYLTPNIANIISKVKFDDQISEYGKNM